MGNKYNTKIKAAVNLYCNADPMMAAVRSFEELAIQNGPHSIIKDAEKYIEEMGLQLWLNLPNPTAVTNGKEVKAMKVKQAIYKAHQHKIHSVVSEERWQGKLIKNRWDNEKVKLKECFAWLILHGRMPQHIPSLEYKSFNKQLLPTKGYYNRKTKQKNKIRSN